MAAVRALISTAPAAMSLAFPKSGCCSIEIRSAKYSTAEFKASNESTCAMHRRRRHHSIRVTSTAMPMMTTATAAVRCIQALGWWQSRSAMPLKAHRKLRRRFLINSNMAVGLLNKWEMVGTKKGVLCKIQNSKRSN